MQQKGLKILASALAEQTYMNHLLVRRLVELGILRPGELKKLFDETPQDRAEFSDDFLRHLASIGLEID